MTPPEVGCAVSAEYMRNTEPPPRGRFVTGGARAMRQSMSGTGNCYDNAPMESFWHSMKVEETRGQDFATRAETTYSVFGYIEGWYNTTQRHSSLGYQSPAQFERACDAKLIEAANDNLSTVSNQHSQSARLNKRAA